MIPLPQANVYNSRYDSILNDVSQPPILKMETLSPYPHS